MISSALGEILVQLARWAGYEPGIVRQMVRRDRLRLALLALASLWTALLMSVGLAVFLGMALRSLFIGAMTLFIGAIVLANLQRLLVAGMGYPCHATEEQISAWVPPWPPLAGFLVISVLSSQAILLLFTSLGSDTSTETARLALVEIRRQMLTTSFEVRKSALLERAAVVEGELSSLAQLEEGSTAERDARRRDHFQLRYRLEAILKEQAALNQERDRALTVDLITYEDHLRKSTLVTERLRHLWLSPLWAAAGTLLLSGLMCIGPLARWPSRRILLRYLALRAQRDRDLIQRDYNETQSLIRARLLGVVQAPWFLDPEPFEDPPFNTRPRDPLRPRAVDPRLLPLSVEEVLNRLPKRTTTPG